MSKSFEIRKKQGYRVLAFLLKNPSEFLSHIRQGFLQLFSYAKEIFLGILICRENFYRIYSFELGIFRLRET